MDEKRTSQVLKQIFDLCGVEVLKDRARFQACLEDLMNGSAYSAERMVLGYALNSSALWPFIKTQSLTADQAGRAVEHLQKENHMTAEDAEFVVRCIVAARGGRADMVPCKKAEQERQRIEDEQRCREEERRKREEAEQKRRDEEERKRQEEAEQKRREAEQKRLEEDQRRSEPLSISCMKQGGFFPRRGVLNLYSDRLLFLPKKGNNQEVLFTDIEKISTYTALKWLTTLFILAIFCGVFAWGYFSGNWEDVSIILLASVPFETLYLLYLIWWCNRAMLIVTQAAGGNPPKQFPIRFYSPGDKKQAVSFIRSHWPKK